MELETYYPDDRPLSTLFPKIEILGVRPRSGRVLTLDYSYYPKHPELEKRIRLKNKSLATCTLAEYLKQKSKKVENIEKWKTVIEDEVRKKIQDLFEDGNPWPFIQEAKANACNLNINFLLLNQVTDKQTDHNPYEKMDLDNLLKPVLDALKKAKLVKDDSYFNAIKAQKIPVDEQGKEGIEISCLSCKKFKIKKVIKNIPGAYFSRFGLKWRSPMRHIEATDITDPKNQITDCKFIDNEPGYYHPASNDEFRAFGPVPGYEWEENEEVEGCIAAKREYKNINLFWLKKWQGNP